MRLSILIPVTPDRRGEVEKLYQSIFDQTAIRLSFPTPIEGVEIRDNGRVEVIQALDNKEMTIGEKRELLYRVSSGTYAWQIDSDDNISDDAISLVLDAINQNPDCITFEEKCLINGQEYTSNHGLKYDDWADRKDGFDYVRTPFFKSVIRTEIAKSVPIPHVRYGEDHQWAQALKPHLKSEVHIDKQLYFYIHNSTEFNERYGFNRS